jgi:predicted NBD/HSP70 family sugar kinase
MTYYAGLDVSLRSAHLCVIDDEGELLAEGKTDSEVDDIVAFLDELAVEIAEGPVLKSSAWRRGR